MTGVDLPAWIQAATGLVQVSHIIWDVHQRRAGQYVERLRRETGLDDNGMAQRLEGRPALADLTVQGLETAMRVAAEEKMSLLAGIVAAAFAGDNARIDESQVMLRTAGALEPYDMRLLTEIAKPRPDKFPDSPIVGATSEEDLAATLPQDQRRLIAPIAATLVREGLILNEGAVADVWGPITAWLLTPYGFRFLRFLPGGSLDGIGGATLVGVYLRRALLVKNLGLGDASLTQGSLVCGGDELIGELELPIEVAAGERVEVPIEDAVPQNRLAVVTLRWSDEEGQDHERRRQQLLP